MPQQNSVNTRVLEKFISDIINSMSSMDKGQDIEKKVSFFNQISELNAHILGCDQPIFRLQIVPISKLLDNKYNPNLMASREFNLLERSMKVDGITSPIIVSQPDEHGYYRVIDGFHRLQIMKKNKSHNLSGYVPVVILDKPADEQLSSLVRHNLARGQHQVNLSSNLIVQLSQCGWDDHKISHELGMDKDEVLRLKQVSGLAAAFKDKSFHQAWE